MICPLRIIRISDCNDTIKEWKNSCITTHCALWSKKYLKCGLLVFAEKQEHSEGENNK